MIFKTRDNQEIWYEVHGKGEPLFLLNGLTQSTASWGLMLEELTRYFKVVLVDFVFQGQSSKSGKYRSFDRHAEDISDLITHLKFDSVFVAGLSYGGITAQHLIVNHPKQVKKAALMACFARKTALFEAMEKSWWAALETGGFNHFLDIIFPWALGNQYLTAPLFTLEQIKESRAGFNTPEAIAKLMQATKERKDFSLALNKVSLPVMVMAGSEDLVFPKQVTKHLAECIPGAEFEVIEGVGHTLNIEAPKTASQLLISFFVNN